MTTPTEPKPKRRGASPELLARMREAKKDGVWVLRAKVIFRAHPELLKKLNPGLKMKSWFRRDKAKLKA